MRKELGKFNSKNGLFVATVGDRGSYIDVNGKCHKTVCLQNVYLKDSELLTEHLWVISNSNLKGITKGNMIQFKGYVSSYYKKDKNTNKTVKDYCINYIKRIKIINNEV